MDLVKASNGYSFMIRPDVPYMAIDYEVRIPHRQSRVVTVISKKRLGKLMKEFIETEAVTGPRAAQELARRIVESTVLP